MIEMFAPSSAALANAGAEVLRNYESVTPSYVAWEVFLLILLILINGFFVAAEFALVKLRLSQLEEPVAEGKGGAKLSQHMLQNLDNYLSACQLGITISCIALGFVSVPFVSSVLQPLLSYFDLAEGTIQIISAVLGVLAVTFLHVVIGEQVPKGLASREPLGTSLICCRPLNGFYHLFKGPIWLLNWGANSLLRLVFRAQPTEESDFTHSADELRILVEETGKAKEVTETEQEILINALELNELSVRDIITPRNDVVSLDINKPFEENLKIAMATKHTRFPLVDGHLDETKGLVHIKDLIVEMQNKEPSLENVLREIMPVPELVKLDEMLKTFQTKKEHVALVVDEYGGSLGLVMLDDVLDQIVGDIQDEFDEDIHSIEKLNEDEFTVEGSFPLHELSDEIEGLELESPDVSTIGGYITSMIGRLPEVGESTEIEGFSVEVTKADERSIREAKFTRIAQPTADQTEELESSQTKEEE